MLEYNDIVYLKNNDLISLQCEKNKNYLSLDLTSYMFKANECHPSLKNKEFQNYQTSEFYVILDKASSSTQTLITTQSIIAMMTK
jgi:hypothetical protein